MKLWHVLAFFIYIASFNEAALAQNCNYNVSLNNFVGEVQDGQQAAVHSLSISKNNNSANCENFRVFFGKGNANSYNRKVFGGTGQVDYNIFKESGLNTVLKDQGEAGAGEYLEGSLPNANTSYSFNFFFKIVDLDSVFSDGPGYFNDLIPVSVYSVKNNGDLQYQTTRYMNVTIVIPRYAELSLGPANAPHNPATTSHIMDFGILQTNEEEEAVLNVKGNVGFGVYMASQHGGKLVNGASEIPYTIDVANLGPRSLSNPGQAYYITQRNSRTPESGTAYALKVRIGNVPANPDSGDYQDVITITVTAW